MKINSLSLIFSLSLILFHTLILYPVKYVLFKQQKGIISSVLSFCGGLNQMIKFISIKIDFRINYYSLKKLRFVEKLRLFLVQSKFQNR